MKQIIIFLFTALFIISFSAKANDTLKVKKLRFFVEPKMLAFIPKQSHLTTNIHDDNIDGSYDENMNVHNKTTFNFGLSAGASFKLSKYFRYNLSLDYYYYSIQTNKTGTYETGWMSFINFSGTQNYNAQSHYVGINNSLSFTYKKFIITNGVIADAIIYAKYNMVSHNTIDNTTTSSSTTYKMPNDFLYNDSYLMSEHKIGYSFLKGKIEAYMGILIRYTKFRTNFNTYNQSYSLGAWDQAKSNRIYTNIMPYTSVKINF